MSYNKFDFINDLLSSKKIKIEEKIKILELTKSELLNFETENSEIKKRVEKIEVKVKKLEGDTNDEYQNITNSITQKENKLPEYIYQKELIKKEPSKVDNSLSNKKNKVIYYTNYKNQPSFLRKLNSNSFTKFLTHDVDSNDYRDLREIFNGKYNYLLHLEKIKEVFSVLTDKNSEFKNNFSDLKRISISQNLYKKIHSYINNETGWGEEDIKMNWSHPDLLNWCKEHQELTPSPGIDLGYEGFKFGNKTFKDIVLDFKNEIHIRNNNSLDFILNKVIFEPQNDIRNKINIEKDINESLEFFTDVEKLKQIIRLIFNLIIEKHQQEGTPEVKFTFNTNKENLELLVLHKESVYGQDIQTLRFGKTSINLMKLSNGLCNMEINAKFPDGKYYSLPIWRSGRKIENDLVFENDREVLPGASITELPEIVNGVVYKLTFHMGL